MEMNELKELVELGMKCPRCNAKDLRISEDDPQNLPTQNLESFICNECGFQWLEDVYPDDDGGWGVDNAYCKAQIETKLRSKRFDMRPIWVLYSANQLDSVKA